MKTKENLNKVSKEIPSGLPDGDFIVIMKSIFELKIWILNLWVKYPQEWYMRRKFKKYLFSNKYSAKAPQEHYKSVAQTYISEYLCRSNSFL